MQGAFCLTMPVNGVVIYGLTSEYDISSQSGHKAS